MKSIETHARAFLPLNNSAVGSVLVDAKYSIVFQTQIIKKFLKAIIFKIYLDLGTAGHEQCNPPDPLVAFHQH